MHNDNYTRQLLLCKYGEEVAPWWVYVSNKYLSSYSTVDSVPKNFFANSLPQHSGEIALLGSHTVKYFVPASCGFSA